MRDIRVALAIFNASVGNTRENLDKASVFVKQAAAEGAEIICFPEMNITGYSNHPDIALQCRYNRGSGPRAKNETHRAGRNGRHPFAVKQRQD